MSQIAFTLLPQKKIRRVPKYTAFWQIRHTICRAEDTRRSTLQEYFLAFVGTKRLQLETQRTGHRLMKKVSQNPLSKAPRQREGCPRTATIAWSHMNIIVLACSRYHHSVRTTRTHTGRSFAMPRKNISLNCTWRKYCTAVYTSGRCHTFDSQWKTPRLRLQTAQRPNNDNTPPEGAETRIAYCHLQLLGLSLSADGPDDPNGGESHQAHARNHTKLTQIRHKVGAQTNDDQQQQSPERTSTEPIAKQRRLLTNDHNRCKYRFAECHG